MKKNKTIRFNDDTIKLINDYALSNGMSFSEVIEQSVLNNKKLNFNLTIKIKQNSIKNNQIRFNLDSFSVEKINKIAINKHSTIINEIRYRLLASLEMPCFDTIELSEINQLRVNLNQLGNLINLAIKNKQTINENHTNELMNLIKNLKLSLENIILLSSKRLM